MINSYKQLYKLIEDGANKPIPLNDVMYNFKQLKQYNEIEVAKWEVKNKIELPIEYKDFLINVGACEIFYDEHKLGIKFHLLESIEDFTREAFNGLPSPYPDLFLIATNLNNGDVIGYNLKIKSENNLSIYSIAEEYPENWININEFISLDTFIDKLVKSNGEDYYL